MSTAIKNHMGPRDRAMLLALSVLWGGSFFFVEVAIAQLPSLTVVLLRVGLAAVVLWIFALVIGLEVPTQPRLWGAFLAMGVRNNVVPFSLIAKRIGLRWIPAHRAFVPRESNPGVDLGHGAHGTDPP